MNLQQGDCLDLMRALPDDCVDLILCDLPYGTTECAWDVVIPFEPLWAQYRRIVKQRAAIVLFGGFPFTGALSLSALDLFRYSLVWKKSRVSRYAQANYRPLNEHEDILIFSRGKCSDNSKIKMKYNPQGLRRIAPVRSVYTAHSLRAGRATKERITTNENFPRSILEFSSDHKPTHPTQKPVALMEYLIRTYTNEGDTVLDNCMGSGTTGVACVNTGRRFIGMEKDPEHFFNASCRIMEALSK